LAVIHRIAAGINTSAEPGRMMMVLSNPKFII
jgi:hypothetical protein